ncbi:hypothetical protein BDV95DRAFT_610075 [Massariosphaeria phaeospora]|uniref:Uncharacterized protein n=1 Tax=Massariosphaeria phaeospora TaxID=100035 RepID=A0A7C8MIQ4_9PLEO|nr:hypothetical protein BDV95DRAFT_610075 [Massariosphaeria phaeospora]
MERRRVRFLTTDTTGDKAANDASGAEKKGFSALLSVEDYQSLTSVSRPLFDKMTERFLRDPAFQEQIKRYLEPEPYIPRPLTPRFAFSRPSNKLRLSERRIFPFMKLPVEVRLMISEYALHYEDGISWSWRIDVDGRAIGSFRVGPLRSTTLNNLCVSRQLRQETQNLVFKVNTLHFGSDRPFRERRPKNPEDSDDSDDFEEPEHVLISRYDRETAALRAYRHFLKHSRPDIVVATKSVVLSITSYSIRPDPLLELFDTMNENQNHQVAVIEGTWLPPIKGKKRVDQFLEKGRRVQARLESLPSIPIERTWRVFPDMDFLLSFYKQDDVIKNLQKHLSASDYDIAVGYIENGI